MKIKAFSELLAVPMDTIRYYEKLGLLQPKRLDNGYREYDEQCANQLKMIVVLKQLGFSLEEIGQLFGLGQQEVTAECNEQAVALFDEKVQQLTATIIFYGQALQQLQFAKSLIELDKYEQNQETIQRAITSLFNELKKGEHHG